MIKKFAILYVDDEPSNLNIFKNTFRREYEVHTALSAKEGLAILEKEQIDLILTDQRMPKMSGVEFLQHAMAKYPDLNRILITAYTEFDALKSAVNDAKIFQYIQKPWSERDLKVVIDRALEVYQLKKENEFLQKELTDKNKVLEDLNMEILELDKLKSDFLAIISHEIRTPLNGLIGPIELLKDVTADGHESLTKLVDILTVSVRRLEQFALLAEKITALKAQRYEMIFRKISLRETIEKAQEICSDMIKQKQIKLDISHSVEEIQADMEMLKICLKELIDNAVKYSDQGGSISVATSEKDNWYVIEVSDNGPGFDEKILKNIFKLFITTNEVQRSNIGLDLALVKLIMDAHSGKIEIENTKHGATVRLSFKKM